jgi:WD40 repeat protein
MAPRPRRAFVRQRPASGLDCAPLSGAVQQKVPQIPDYDLVRLIGSGSYGDVWLARAVTGVFRAVKVVWRERFNDPRPYAREFEGITRFAEVSLREPSQLALLHAGRNDEAGFFYYVMELADDAERGREIEPDTYVPLTLKELRERRAHLPVAEAVALGVALARALASLHAGGLVHRDIKPSNIVLVGGVPKLADVGLVAAASEGLTFVGTEGFVPPEGPGAPAADVFSLGKVLYELATGMDRQDFPRLPPNLADWPDRREFLELNEVLLRACEPNALHRFAHASALLDELLLLQAGKSVRRLRNAERRTARALRIAAVLALVAAVAGGGAYAQYLRAEKAVAERMEISRRATYSGNLAKAQRALANGDLSQARRLLDELRPQPGEIDLRGFEWRALWHQAQGDPHEVLRAAGGPEIDRLMLSPDQSLLAVRDKSNTLTVYATATRKKVATIPDLWAFAGFSVDGQWIVGTDTAMLTHRWSMPDGVRDASTTDIGLPIHALGPTTVAAISRLGPSQMRIWDFATGVRVQTIPLDANDTSERWAGLFSEISGDRRTIVRAWMSGTGNDARFRITCVRLGETPEVTHRELGLNRPGAVGVDSIGPWALVHTGDAESKGELWRCTSGGWTRTEVGLPQHAIKFEEIGVPGKRDRVVARLRELAWLDAPESEGEAVARGHEAGLTDMVVCRRQNLIFTAASDGSLFYWPTRRPAPTKFIPRAPASASNTQAVFLNDGRTVWIPENDSTCVRLDVATLAPVGRAADMVYPIVLGNEGLIGVGRTAGLVIADPLSGDFVKRVMISNVPIKLARASSRAELAAVDQEGNLFAREKDRARFVTADFTHIYALALDSGGSRLWAARRSPQLACMAWPDGKEIWRITPPAIATTLLLEPGERRLVVALNNGTLEFRDPATGRLVGNPIASGSAEPRALAFSPDGKRLFVGGAEGEIHYFDAHSLVEIHVQPLHTNAPLHRLACSPDGKTLAALTTTGALYVVRTQ